MECICVWCVYVCVWERETESTETCACFCQHLIKNGVWGVLAHIKIYKILCSCHLFWITDVSSIASMMMYLCLLQNKYTYPLSYFATQELCRKIHDIKGEWIAVFLVEGHSAITVCEKSCVINYIAISAYWLGVCHEKKKVYLGVVCFTWHVCPCTILCITW